MSELPVSLQGKKLPEATDCKNPEDATSRGERTGLSKKKKIIEKEGEKEIKGAINVQPRFGQYLVMLYFQKYNAIP